VAALSVVGLFAALALVAPAAAQSQLNVRSVGELFVDAQGRASGQNVVAVLNEATGQVKGFTSLALAAEVFSSVTIDGFAQAEKIKGVGSSALVLKGTNAVVSLHDDINTAFKVAATQATTVRYRLAADVTAKADSGKQGVVDLYGEGGTWLGSLVAVAHKWEGVVVTSTEVRVDAKAGSQVVFLGRPVYVGGAEFLRAVVSAAAEGALASSFVTEFEGSAVASSQVDYASVYSARTVATAKGSVQTDVKARAETAAVLAYDLAYETLPARSPNEVAVYVDGQLAERAATASQVATYAAAGIATYFAQSGNGRNQVLVATPDFSAASEHRVTLVANAHASTQAQADAENGAESDSRVYGDFEYHHNGKLTGDFLTSVLMDGKTQLWSYTSLASRTEIFKTVVVDGAAQGSFRSVEGHHFRVDGPKADLTLVDDVYATLLVDAKARSETVFTLGEGVKARPVDDEVVHLEGPNGDAGVLVLLQGDAAARSRFDAGAEGQVKARLEQGSRVLYRGAGDGYQSEDVVARAIAEGRIGAQLLAGVQGSALATASTAYSAAVTAAIQAQARGSLAIDYTSQADAAKSFVLDARGTSLAAKAASDVRVLVDGRAAIQASDASAALAASGYAKWYAETSLDGSLRVLVNTAAATGHTAQVLVESKVVASARAAARTDAFGTFKLFYDGTAVGSFVSLKSDQQAGAVSDLTLLSTGQTVFTSLAAGASSYLGAGADGASTLVLENKESRTEVSDTTSGFMRIVAKTQTEASFRLAADLRAEERGSAVVEIVTAEGAHVGSLILTNAQGGAATASRFRATAEGQVRAELEGGAQVLFRTHVGIEAELSAAQRTMINEAIAAGRVAGQVVVQTQASLSAQAHAAAEAHARAEAQAHARGETALESVAVTSAEASGKVTAAVTANYFADVQMLTAATRERVDVTISSTAQVGKTVIVSLDPETVPGMGSGDAMILFDGEVAAQASSYADILDANDDNGVAEYFVLAGEAGTQVLVSIPHFSVHTVTLQQRPVEANHLYMYATMFLAVVLLVETAVLVRRRKA
jgi:hypothetical protein